ncbi:MAG: ORF6N domain-containing protein [Bacteroidales bacterium]|nr:ORF6N domain-containing protein [Bacteroidales bacterium]MCK4638339.1 ORF6N domain-containing protein [Bacteroidales bacterium]
MSNNIILKEENIVERIFFIRGHKVMIDSDLAHLYGVATGRLNEQVKRNSKRFPADFMFRLTKEEWENLKSQIALSSLQSKSLKSQNAISITTDTKADWGGRRKLPYVFTEHGTVMLASVLNSEIAVNASIYIVRAFIKLREILFSHKKLERKIEQIENKYDNQFKIIFETIKQLIQHKQTPRKPIGYKIGKNK